MTDVCEIYCILSREFKIIFIVENAINMVLIVLNYVVLDCITYTLTSLLSTSHPGSVGVNILVNSNLIVFYAISW